MRPGKLARASLSARSSIHPGRIDALARQTRIYEAPGGEHEQSYHGGDKGKHDHKSSAIAGRSGGRVCIHAGASLWVTLEGA